MANMISRAFLILFVVVLVSTLLASPATAARDLSIKDGFFLGSVKPVKPPYIAPGRWCAKPPCD